MTPEAMQAACALLYRHWSHQTRIEALPSGLRPQTRAEGYGVQAFLEAYSKQPLYGWKIAATSPAGQAHIAVDGPLAGRLLAERVIPDGGSFALGKNLMRVAELEFAFTLARDLPPRPEPYTREEVMGCVAGLHPAIEIPDSRFEPFERAGLAQLVADNACAHLFLLGAAAPESWRDLDLSVHTVQAFRNGQDAGFGTGANVLGDPRIALTWLVNELSRHGLTLGAGQVVTTGTCIKPLAIAPGERISGDFGVLGRVSVTVT